MSYDELKKDFCRFNYLIINTNEWYKFKKKVLKSNDADIAICIMSRFNLFITTTKCYFFDKNMSQKERKAVLRQEAKAELSKINQNNPKELYKFLAGE